MQSLHRVALSVAECWSIDRIYRVAVTLFSETPEADVADLTNLKHFSEPEWIFTIHAIAAHFGLNFATLLDAEPLARNFRDEFLVAPDEGNYSSWNPPHL